MSPSLRSSEIRIRPAAVAATTTSWAGAPVRPSSVTISTFWSALVKIAADETGRFSTSLNFTVTATAEQFFARKCGTVGGRAYARHGDHGIFGGDLFGRHAGGQAVQDHADRHACSGDHGLAVHHLGWRPLSAG